MLTISAIASSILLLLLSVVTILMTMSWCKDLKESIKTDSKWKPIIIFPSSHALLINNSVMLSSHNNFIPSNKTNNPRGYC